ncbi:MAG: serine protease [Thiohalocapsa sp.]
MSLSALKDELLARSTERYQAVRSTIEQTVKLLDKGLIAQVESPERLRKYEQRELRRQVEDIRAGRPLIKAQAVGLERAIGLTRDFLSIEFLEVGLETARAVGLVEIMGGAEFGTGFLIGNGLMMTNNHVLPDPERAHDSEFVLDFEHNRIGTRKTAERFAFEPERFFLTDEEHDYSLIAVAPASDAGRPLAQFGYLPLLAEEGKIRIGDPVNIIQHPDGRMKTVVMHDSRFLHLDNEAEEDRYCWYTSDTEPGSSGSPVFNNRWEVVALHHKSVPKMNARGQYLDLSGRVISKERAEEQPELLVWIANEGVRVSRLVRSIQDATLDSDDQTRQRDELLELWKRPLPSIVGAEAGTAAGQPPINIAAEGAAALPWPIEVTVRIGPAG